MNILQIVIKEIKQNVRDKKAMSMMILFPIVLILVLGSALKGNFSTTSIGDTTKVLYKIESTSEAAKNFKENIIDQGKSFHMQFTKTNDIEAAKEQIKGYGKYDSLIVMKDDNNIQIYKNSRYNLMSGLTESIINTYVQRYNTIVEIAKVNPMKLREVLANTNSNYTSIKSINKTRTPSSVDYYSVTMLTLIVMYATNTSLSGIVSEKNNKTRDRVLSAPIKRYEFLAGKTLGFACITALQVAILILFTKYALNSYWGNNIGPVLLVLISQIIMVVGIGTGFGFIFKNENSANAILSFSIPAVEFLGGGYFPVDAIDSKVFQLITNLSPVKWTNNAIFGVIYNNDISKVLPAVVINLSIAVFFIVISSIIFRKQVA